MKSKEQIVAEYERSRPVHRDLDSPDEIRITGIDLPFKDITIVSLKIAVVWAVLGAIAWAVVLQFN